MRKQYRKNPTSWPKRRVAWDFVEHHTKEAGYARVDESRAVFGENKYSIYALALFPLDNYTEDDRKKIKKETSRAFAIIPRPDVDKANLISIDDLIHEYGIYVPIAFATTNAWRGAPEPFDHAWKMFDTAHLQFEQIMAEFTPEEAITRRGRLLEHEDFQIPGKKVKKRKQTAEEQLLARTFGEDPGEEVDDVPSYYLTLHEHGLSSADEEIEFVNLKDIGYRLAGIRVPVNISAEFSNAIADYVMRILKVSGDYIKEHRLVIWDSWDSWDYETSEPYNMIYFPVQKWQKWKDGPNEWLPTLEKIPQFLREFQDMRSSERILDLEDHEDFEDEDDEAGRWLKKRR